MTPSPQIFQLGDILATAGAAIGILRWFAPYVIRFYFDRRMEHLDKERANLVIQAENEALRKKNADLQISRLDEMVKLHSHQMGVLGQQLITTTHEVRELRAGLSATDETVAQLLAYRSQFDKVTAMFDVVKKAVKITEKDKLTPSQFPEQEHVQVGNLEFIKGKKPEEE